jgi:hypothetical protein
LQQAREGQSECRWGCEVIAQEVELGRQSEPVTVGDGEAQKNVLANDEKKAHC